MIGGASLPYLSWIGDVFALDVCSAKSRPALNECLALHIAVSCAFLLLGAAYLTTSFRLERIALRNAAFEAKYDR